MSTYSVSDIATQYNYVKCKLDVPNCQLANKFCQIMSADIPTLAIDEIEIYTNTTILPNEYLAHRIGLIPVSYKQREIPEINLNTEKFYMEINVHATKTVRNVMTKDFHINGDMNIINDDILICKLLPGQSLHFKCYVKVNTGEEHAKWSPITISTFKQSGRTYIVEAELIGIISGENLIKTTIEILNK